MAPSRPCPDCEAPSSTPVTRRDFVRVVGAAAALAAVPRSPLFAGVKDATADKSKPESLVARLYQSMTPKQKGLVCFDWDHTDDRGLLRTHVSNNWHITTPKVAGDFFTADQQEMIEAIFWGLYNPEWKDRIKRQLQDDAGGYGKEQNIAIFGAPGTGKFEFVMTGRHLTIRCDGDSTDHVAFGGPIFYGHAASGFTEKAGHPDNVFWHQALKANAVYTMLDGRQRQAALIEKSPAESAVHFRGAKGPEFGLPVAEMSSDQKDQLQKTLDSLLEPYRAGDREEALQALKTQGGLEKCRLAFFEKDDKGNAADLGEDGVWDIWRLEGPGFVWHYRGVPHVHVWVNIASDPSVKITTQG